MNPVTPLKKVYVIDRTASSPRAIVIWPTTELEFACDISSWVGEAHSRRSLKVCINFLNDSGLKTDLSNLLVSLKNWIQGVNCDASIAPPLDLR